MIKDKKKQLSDDDEALWAEVQRTIIPLRERALYAGNAQVSSRKVKSNPKDEKDNNAASNIGRVAQETSAKFKKQNGSLNKNISMDRKNFQRLIKGKKPIDEKLDLHGLTLLEAEKKVQTRLVAAHNAGKRLVLVVTGKGNHKKTDEFFRSQSGVIRKNLPIWCSHAPLANIILHISEAQRQHGGSGAYYVYLRRIR